VRGNVGIFSALHKPQYDHETVPTQKNRSTQAWVPRYRHLFVGIIYGLDKLDSHLALTNFTGYDNVAIQQTGLLPLRRGCSLRNTSTHGVRVS